MVAAFLRSGETVAAFARRHGLVDQRVRRWLGRRGDGPLTGQVSFAPIAIVAAPKPTPLDPQARGAIEVVVGEVVVRVGRGFDVEVFRDVLAALGAAC